MTTTAVPNLPEPSPSARRKAHRRLETALEPYRAYCGWIDAPFGEVFLARTERGLCRVSFRKTERTLMEELEQRALLPELAPSKLERERKQLSEYFGGKTPAVRFTHRPPLGNRVSAGGARGGTAHSFRRMRVLRRRRQAHRTPESSARGRQCAREQPGGHRHPLSPGGGFGGAPRRLYRRSGHQRNAHGDRGDRDRGGHMTDASVAFAKELIPPAWCSAPLKIRVYADSCGLKTAFLGNGGRNAATIFSLRYSSSR